MKSNIKTSKGLKLFICLLTLAIFLSFVAYADDSRIGKDNGNGNDIGNNGQGKGPGSDTAPSIDSPPSDPSPGSPDAPGSPSIPSAPSTLPADGGSPGKVPGDESPSAPVGNPVVATATSSSDDPYYDVRNVPKPSAQVDSIYV